MTLTPPLGTLWRTVSRGGVSDLALVASLAGIIALMVLPLPSLALDVLIAANITIGVLLLMMSVYIGSPLEFSAFPSLLLITTLYRLSLSIATTRLILTEGRAGHIIETFGLMAAGGNLVVGLVVFLIITVVQFIVIAKGAERVAEVAARFSLDSMPGKQLSIDSDLRSGLADQDEARRRRRTLELESKLHGNLDGAMKFVKGDAIAGIVIVIVNLLGGLAVGLLQHGMGLADAVRTYSILTIGDGMVTQIPALLGAMAAGLIVTRATDETEDAHLGQAVQRQFARKPRVPLMAGLLSCIMALVPGFPSAVFLVLGVAGVATGVALDPPLRRRLAAPLQPLLRALGQAPSAGPARGSTRSVAWNPVAPLALELGGAAVVDGEVLRLGLEAVQAGFERDLGLTLPPIEVCPALDGQDGWRLLAFEAPIAAGTVAGREPVAALKTAVREALRRNLGAFVGMQEASAMLNRLAASHPEALKELGRALPVMRVAEVLRRLVEEEVSVRNLHIVVETLSDLGQKEKDPAVLTEFVRIALKRHLVLRYAPAGELRALALTPSLETQLREAASTEGGVHQLALDPFVAQTLVAQIGAQAAEAGATVLLTALDLRRPLRKLIEADLFDLGVLAYHELPPSLRLEIVGRLSPIRPMEVGTVA